MKILINSFGTRGDIQPYIALARGLKAADYDVAFCTSEGYKQDIEKHDIQYLYMKNEMLELTQHLLETDSLSERFSTAKKIGGAVRGVMDDEWAAAEAFQPDSLIYHPKCLGSYHVAEKLGIPAILSIPLPFYTPTSEFAVPFVARNLRFLNRFSFNAIITASNAGYAGSVNDFRKKVLSLPPIGRFTNLLKRSDGRDVSILYPISPHVVPVPADYPPHVHMTGYWFLDEENTWQPEPELVEFLEAGAKPIYVGFGSMSAVNSKKRTQEVIDGIRKSGQRAVFASGWSNLEQFDFPDTIYPLNSVSHTWLFPQVAAVIHHGGAGTAAAGLRAGKPTLICPFLGDQPFWGKRVYDLGVGAKPIPQSKLRADNLAQAINTMLTDSAMQERASVLGEKIRSEDGIACAEQGIRAILKG